MEEIEDVWKRVMEDYWKYSPRFVAMWPLLIKKDREDGYTKAVIKKYKLDDGRVDDHSLMLYWSFARALGTRFFCTCDQLNHDTAPTIMKRRKGGKRGEVVLMRYRRPRYINGVRGHPNTPK